MWWSCLQTSLFPTVYAFVVRTEVVRRIASQRGCKGQETFFLFSPGFCGAGKSKGSLPRCCFCLCAAEAPSSTARQVPGSHCPAVATGAGAGPSFP